MPQHNQLANSRTTSHARQQFARNSCGGSSSTTMAAAAAPVAASSSMPSRDEVKLIVEKAKMCADPAGYMKCVVSNYAASASGSKLASRDCSQYCKSSQ